MLRIRCLILHERQPAMRAWLRDSLSGSVSTFALCLGQLGPNETADIPGRSGSPTPTCFGTAHLTLRDQTHCKCFASGSLAFQEWLESDVYVSCQPHTALGSKLAHTDRAEFAVRTEAVIDGCRPDTKSCKERCNFKSTHQANE